MTDNDTAMDAIDDFIALHFEGSIDEDYETVGTLPTQEFIDDVWSREDEAEWHPRCLLGVAEFLLDHGYNVNTIHDEIVNAYDAEMDPLVSDRWDDPEARRQALRDFLKRVDES
jgi:hypothetical protein